MALFISAERPRAGEQVIAARPLDLPVLDSTAETALSPALSVYKITE